MKTRKYTVPSKPSVSDGGKDRPRERRTLGVRFGAGGDAQGSDLSR